MKEKAISFPYSFLFFSLILGGSCWKRLGDMLSCVFLFQGEDSQPVKVSSKLRARLGRGGELNLAGMEC